MASFVLAIFLLAAVQDQVSCITRTKVNEVRLNDLTDKLDSLKEKVGESVLEERRKELVEMDGRVNDLEDNGCAKREYRCGSLVKQCIFDLLVCDGSEDCTDGSDEKHCNNPAPSGIAFSGNLYNVHCLATDIPETLTIDVIGQKNTLWFTTISELDVRLTGVKHDGTVRQADYKAVYFFGQRILAVYPHAGDHIAITCKFRTDSSEFCHAKLGSINTSEVCGEAVMSKVDR